MAQTNSAPVISLLTPSSLTAGAPTFTLGVSSVFTSTTVVQWNGANLPTIVLSSTQLTAIVNAGLLLSPGSVAITVYEEELMTDDWTDSVTFIST